MKVKVINRVEEEFTRERSQDLKKVFHTYNPDEHKFEKAHEYTRALNAAKLQRIFAKPFVAAFAHDDGVTCLARNPRAINSVVCGCADGDIRVWDIPGARCLRRLVGHSGAIRGLSFAPDGATCVSAAHDSTVKLWKVPYAPPEPGAVEARDSPVMEFQGRTAFRGIDHHWSARQFATCGAAVEVWEHERSEPLLTFTWGADSTLAVRFNPVEPNLLASTGSDRAIALYDTRARAALRRTVLATRSNALAWNPQEAFNFTVANEDCNLYTFDMRRLNTATCVHKDFVSAVTDVDYAPSGREFVAGGYDRSVRVFARDGGHSRDVYTARRMARVACVRFSGDAAYVLSGSDDMNLRVWKAVAWEAGGVRLVREQRKSQYQEALLARYGHLPEIRRITRHRHLPASIYKAKKMRQAQSQSAQRKTANRARHSAPGSVKTKPERKRRVVATLD